MLSFGVVYGGLGVGQPVVVLNGGLLLVVVVVLGGRGVVGLGCGVSPPKMKQISYTTIAAELVGSV